MAHNTCKYCGAKLRLISVKGGFCSFTCRAKWKAYKGYKRAGKIYFNGVMAYIFKCVMRFVCEYSQPSRKRAPLV